MPLILGANSATDTGYNIDNSIRYDKNSSQSLSRTCGSSASSYTLSLWVKNCEPQGGDTTAIYWNGAGAKLNWEFNGVSAIYWYDPETRTTAYYRDVSAWYHLVWSVNSNVGTLYVNNVAAPGLTSVSGIDSLNSGNQIYLGNDAGAYSPQNGYFSEVCFIDGTALNATDFGEYDEDSGIWKPIDVSGLSFGSNGFYLDFKDSSALGNDVSGNNNDLTANSFSSLNQSTDTPTNNYATANVLDLSGGNLSKGNTKLTADGGWDGVRATVHYPSSGKWYAELYVNSRSTGVSVGVLRTDRKILGDLGNDVGAYVYNSGDGRKYNNGGNSAYGATWGTGDTISVLWDADTNTLVFYKNGVSQGTAWSSLTGEYGLAFNCNGSDSATINFGNPSITISSGNSDANGYGNFEYAVPSGYYALNTKNLAEYG